MDMVQDMLSQLKQFIAYPTVSSDSRQRQTMYECAGWLAQHLRSIGMQKVNIYRTSLHPLVYAEYRSDPSRPTLLFYGHYDVQPADPVEKWATPPFLPSVRGKYIFGRGASDDKGQLFIHIKAIEQLIQEGNGRLPLNVKFLIEGAEEIGSVGLKEFVAERKQLLQCDAAIVSDSRMADLDDPAITWSLRGALNMELEIRTLGNDLHSGTFGGAVNNAATRMAAFIAGLHNKEGIISIPGFYDAVRSYSSKDRALIVKDGIRDLHLLHDAKALGSWGERGYSLYERVTIRPSLAITGLHAGFGGQGVKNVIPSTAVAKFNIRLVPDQDPEMIRLLLEAHVRNTIQDAAWRLSFSSFNRPVTVSRKDPYVMAAARACEDVFRKKPRFLMNGGTIGAVDHLHDLLGIPIVLMGFAQGSDNMHAPDEKFYLPNLFKGIRTIKKMIRYASVNY